MAEPRKHQPFEYDPRDGADGTKPTRAVVFTAVGFYAHPNLPAEAIKESFERTMRAYGFTDIRIVVES